MATTSRLRGVPCRFTANRQSRPASSALSPATSCSSAADARLASAARLKLGRDGFTGGCGPAFSRHRYREDQQRERLVGACQVPERPAHAPPTPAAHPTEHPGACPRHPAWNLASGSNGRAVHSARYGATRRPNAAESSRCAPRFHAAGSPSPARASARSSAQSRPSTSSIGRPPGTLRGVHAPLLGRYCTASATWAAEIWAEPSRSAMVRATFRMRW